VVVVVVVVAVVVVVVVAAARALDVADLAAVSALVVVVAPTAAAAAAVEVGVSLAGGAVFPAGHRDGREESACICVWLLCRLCLRVSCLRKKPASELCSTYHPMK